MPRTVNRDSLPFFTFQCAYQGMRRHPADVFFERSEWWTGVRRSIFVLDPSWLGDRTIRQHSPAEATGGAVVPWRQSSAAAFNS